MSGKNLIAYRFRLHIREVGFSHVGAILAPSAEAVNRTLLTHYCTLYGYRFCKEKPDCKKHKSCAIIKKQLAAPKSDEKFSIDLLSNEQVKIMLDAVDCCWFVEEITERIDDSGRMSSADLPYWSFTHHDDNCSNSAPDLCE
jgi:hypothetical protein